MSAWLGDHGLGSSQRRLRRRAASRLKPSQSRRTCETSSVPRVRRVPSPSWITASARRRGSPPRLLVLGERGSIDPVGRPSERIGTGDRWSGPGRRGQIEQSRESFSPCGAAPGVARMTIAFRGAMRAVSPRRAPRAPSSRKPSGRRGRPCPSSNARSTRTHGGSPPPRPAADGRRCRGKRQCGTRSGARRTDSSAAPGAHGMADGDDRPPQRERRPRHAGDEIGVEIGHGNDGMGRERLDLRGPDARVAEKPERNIAKPIPRPSRRDFRS